MLRVKFISPLEKVFRDSEPTQTEFCKFAYKGEPLFFQVCVTTTITGALYVDVQSDIADFIEWKEVKYVPSLVADYENPDDYRIFTERSSTYYPDVLENPSPSFRVVQGYWSTMYFTVKAGAPSGEHFIRLTMGDYNYRDVLAEESLFFTIGQTSLEKCDIPVSCWIYYDSIAKAHKKKLFSDNYFKVLKKYFLHAVENGMNTVFVPLISHAQKDVRGVTPAVTQLVQVEEKEGEFIFDFSLLKRFLRLAVDCGYEYFETSHIASQQGARHCPKIVGKRNGEEVTLFDCHVSATDPRYVRFLRGMLRGVKGVFEDFGILERSYFHISDEPQRNSAGNYIKIGEIVREILPECKLIDALSDVEFAEKKILDFSAASTNHAKEFSDRGHEIWVYYCCDQSGDYLSNRFFNFPLLRTRVIGAQWYLNDAKGFLHWAYNQWLHLSALEYLDPRLSSDGGGIMPSGDCYLIYPDVKNGAPCSSVREKAFADGVCDFRALKTLEKKKSRAFVVALLKENGFDGWTKYTHDEKTFLAFWEKVRKLIEE